MRHNSLVISLEQLLKAKKEIEACAQKTLLKAVLHLSSENAYFFPHNIDMLRLIVQYFIRSAWILEGLAPAAGGDNQQPRRGDNLQKLIEYTCQVVKATEAKSYYVVCVDGGFKQMSVHRDDLVTMVHFLVQRLTIDNRGPNHPASYDSTFLQSDLFKDAIFGRIMDLPIRGESVDRYNNSRLKNVFIQQLATFCYNDPTQIPRMLENGTLPRVANMLKEYYPVHQVTTHVLFEFVRMIVVHEQGRDFIKEHKLFEQFMMPCVQEGSEYKESNQDMVI